MKDLLARPKLNNAALSAPPPYRVLLVDDQDDYLEFACPMLNDHAELNVVGQASSGAEALRKIERCAPHVVVMDVQMPGMSGFTAAKRILEAHADVRVILVSAADEAHLDRQARNAGAVGFISKMDLMPECVIELVAESFAEMPQAA